MPEVWQIVLVVWIVVIPASIAMLAALAARRRAAARRGTGDQLGKLLRFPSGEPAGRPGERGVPGSASRIA